MHARKPKDLDERLVRYAAGIERDPCALRGRWLAELLPDGRQLHVDLGCGKGAFALAAACAHPDRLYVGIDCEKLCMAFAAQKACETDAENLRFALAGADELADMFAPGEIDALHLNFPTPHPRKKHARKRLTDVERLVAYRELLAPGAAVHLRTDSQPFFDFSLTQFELAAYDITWLSRDLRAECGGDAESEYERRLAEKGARIHALTAVPSARTPSTEQTAELSLMAYLPDDLDSLDYVPFGMERAVENFRNRRAKQRLSHDSVTDPRSA